MGSYPSSATDCPWTQATNEPAQRHVVSKLSRGDLNVHVPTHSLSTPRQSSSEATGASAFGATTGAGAEPPQAATRAIAIRRTGATIHVRRTP